MDHGEFSRTGVIGNPMRATAEKGEEALERFSDHLARAIDEFRELERARCGGGRSRSAYEHRAARPAPGQQILERIQRDGGVSVADLARDLTVSSITVHRDLEQLSRDGLVERVHGGARSMPAAGPPTAIPPTGWEQRAAVGRGAKATIAAHAAREVRSGSTIFLDSSSSLPGAGAPARERARDRADAGHELAGDRLRARRRADPRDRHAGRARPAHAAARRPLDDRLPRRAQLRARVLLVRPGSRWTRG